MDTSAPYTLIPYLYRDADNHKQHGLLIADGHISPEQKTAMVAVLDVDDTFIPTQLGLGHLGDLMDGFPGDEDHPWHEIDLDAAETGTGDPGAVGLRVGDITTFVDLFVAEGTKGWDDTRDV